MGKGDIKAFLGAGSSFEGKLVFDEIVRLDGNFTGEVSSKGALIIGESAMVKAEVDVESLTVSGKFKGNIRARSKVELKKPAQVEGNIDTPALSVEEGVMLNGTVSMGGQKLTPLTPEKSSIKTVEPPS
ncbi:MAG: polymer-forming cytoskeletal protein [Deltaproteobacteria bacterium]|nr:polymer-forming cytoskeletal protein [Deltaproteobacteria bacterium]